MKYILILITIIIVTSIIYLQSKEKSPKNTIVETKIVNSIQNKDTRAKTKTTQKVDLENTTSVNIKHNRQANQGNEEIEKIPYHNELSLDSNYDPEYHKVEEKLLTEEDFKNFEKNSEIVNLSEIDQVEVLTPFPEEDENFSTSNLTESNYDPEYNKVEQKTLTEEDFENFEVDMPKAEDKEDFIEYNDSNFLNELFSKT